MTIEGVGPLTAACLIAELGDPARFDSPGAIASYVGVVPRIRQSGKKRFTKGPAIPFGNALAQIALYGGSATNPAQRPAAAVLRTAAGCRETGQGCGHRSNAKVARCCVECRDSPETLRADNAGPGRDLTPPFGRATKNYRSNRPDL
jgi:Transposase IS116/IS110/IS902 family